MEERRRKHEEKKKIRQKMKTKVKPNKPVYLVVHPQVHPYPGWYQPEKEAELERVLKEEETFILKESTGNLPKGLPKDRPIRVCGIYQEICVWQVWDDLKDRGYDATIYEEASYNAPGKIQEK